MLTTNHAVPTAARDDRPAFIRSLQVALVVATSLVAFSARVSAQPPVRTGSFELRPYVGAFIPTGEQRDLLKDAVFAGAQASYNMLPQLALTGTFGWSPSKDRIATGDQTLDVFQYDIGAEARAASWYRGGAWDFTPFAGLGVGGRTYDYRDLDDSPKTNVAGYGALGGELGFGKVGIRVEARDYVSQFKPLSGRGDTKARNDVTLAAGLTVRF